MTTRTELLEILLGSENSGVEFKRDDLSPDGLAKELVAFSNFEGGKVLIGVEDDGSVSGLNHDDIKQFEEWIMNVCRDKIRPPIIPFFEVVQNVREDKNIAIIRVPRGYSVHALQHNKTNRYLIRVGSQSREASHEELERLFQRKGKLRAELMPVSGAAQFDLDQRRLQNYFHNIRQQDVPDMDDNIAWQRLLLNTKIMIEEGVSVGGLLLFGKKPNHFLNYAGINAVAFNGIEKDYDTQERMLLRGPILPLLDNSDDIIENGLVEMALDFVQRNTPTVVKSQGGRRVESPIYPKDALREVIVNALIHRDYLFSNTDIELSVYPNRLEIISPGRPPNGITPEQIRSGARTARNEFLKDVMRDYRYVENLGMGIPRKVIKGMKEHNGTEPDLVIQGEQFLVRLHATGHE